LKTILHFFVLMLALVTGQANAAFVDAYDVDNWDRAINKGAINTKSAPDLIKLTSSNNGNGNRNQDFTIEAVASGLVTFNWSYVTSDSQKDAKFDPFGWLLNGVFTQLTVNGKNNINQSGIFSSMVKAGDMFGFRANSLNSKFGAATTTISNFSAPSQVPVPAAIWLIGAPLMGLLGKKRKSIII
jgi:hypothetical protein